MTNYIAYFRVSTKKQGQSGLGMEAQQQAVNTFVNGHGKLLASYTEIESGKNPIDQNWLKPLVIQEDQKQF